ALRAWIHARADEADAAIADVYHMVRRRLAAFQMRESHHHVDRVGSDFHDLHHGAACLFEQLSCRIGLVDAGHDQGRRALAEEQLEKTPLLDTRIMRMGELDPERAV